MTKEPLTAMSNVETGKGICSTAATSSSCVSPSRRIPENQSKEKANVAELKNGKIVFRQKSHSFEKHSETLQELVKFREMLSERSKSNLPLTEIEDEYRPLIVKLAYESDKTLNTLAKHIHSQLLPSDDEDEDMDPAALSKIFPVATIEKAIQVVMNRNNYGLELDSTVKIPNQLCIWRWEAKENYQHCLPKAALEKVAARLAERAQAKVNLLAAFNALSEAERTALIPNRGTSKSGKEASTSTTSPPVPAPGPSTNSAPSTSSSPSKQAETNDSESPKAKAGRPKKPENTERLAKAKKQKEAQKSLMANFFNSKPKAQTSNHLNGKATSSKTDISEFEKTFKSFVHKKDTELAPVNAFLNRKKRVASGTSKDIIVVDSDDESMPRSTRPVNQLSIRERLRDAMSALPEHPHYLPPRSSSQQNTPSCKTYYSPSVRELMKRLSEAEMTDDTSAVRSITQTLANRQILPAKVLIFHEDNRPGYFGTWTRSSRVVGSRTPFAKDVVDIDYGYDSGEDWDEGENAGDADDVVDEDDDDQDSEDQESDMDDWLVDDDEVEESAPPPPDLTLPDVPLPTKRKAEEDEKASKKRKVVVPLVPYAKGPCWESVIGECTDNVLSPYQIRFFNDASYSLDPFTFVSTMNETVKRKQKTEPVFAVPSLPHRAADASNPSAPPNTPAVKKSAPVAPKTAFPEAHLPVLLDKVNTLQSGNLTVLVEVVFQELRAHKVKKNAIEAKIKEVGMKCRDRKYWVVRENASSHSSAPMDTS